MVRPIQEKEYDFEREFQREEEACSDLEIQELYELVDTLKCRISFLTKLLMEKVNFNKEEKRLLSQLILPGKKKRHPIFADRVPNDVDTLRKLDEIIGVGTVKKAVVVPNCPIDENKKLKKLIGRQKISGVLAKIIRDKKLVPNTHVIKVDSSDSYSKVFKILKENKIRIVKQGLQSFLVRNINLKAAKEIIDLGIAVMPKFKKS